MGRKWNPDGVPDDLLLPKGNYLFEIDEIAEADINGKLVYKPELTVVEPKAYKGKKLFGLTYWIGTDEDKTARDPETWAAARGAVELKKLIAKSGVKLTRDIDEDRASAMGRIVGITVGKKTRKDGSRDDNVATDYWKSGERALEIFDDGGKATAASAPAPAPKKQPPPPPVDEDDDEEDEAPPAKEPPKRSTEGEIPKPGKPKKADQKQCPKCGESFPRSELLTHLAECEVGDDDEDDDD